MQSPQPSVLNHFNSLPDNLNKYKQNNGLKLAECNIGDDEEKANNEDDLTDESPNTCKPRSLSHSLNNKISYSLCKTFESNCFSKLDNQTKLTSNISKPFIHLIKTYKKLDSDSDSGLFSATEDLNDQQTQPLSIVIDDPSLSVDKFQQELVNKAHEMSTKQQARKMSQDIRPRAFSIISKKSLIGSARKNSRSNLASQQEEVILNQREFDMPSLTEINETTAVTFNTGEFQSDREPVRDVEQESELISHLSIAANQLNVEPNTNKTNLLTSLEYLMNNSKSNVFNTTVAIANIAAAASAAASVDSNLVANDTETALQNFFMDLVIPNVDPSSVNDTSDLTLIYQQHFIENSNLLAPTNQSSAGLSGVCNSDGAGLTNIQELHSSNFNLNNSNANDQMANINSQIMRTCMSYLDYINKKHNKERKTQERRNKISGFVLLTLVFLMIFGLGLIMFYCLTDALAHILKKSYVKPSHEPNKNISAHLDKISSYSANKIKNRDLFSMKTAGITDNTAQLDLIVQKEIRLEAEYFTESLFEKLSKRIDITYERQNLVKLQDIVVNLVLIVLNSNRSIFDENTEQHYFKYIDEIDQGFENNC